MAVLERSELQASTLADLHAIADQLGLDGFRRLRKAELIDAILGDDAPAATVPDEPAAASSGEPAEPEAEREPEAEVERSGATRSRRRGGRSSAARSRRSPAADADEDEP